MTFCSPIGALLFLEESKRKGKKKKLKKCAECGSKAKIHLRHGNMIDTYYVKCKSCGASTRDFFSKKDARKAWNERKKVEE